MSTSPRIGVIGLGSIGQTHIRTWQELDCPIVAIADISEDVLATTTEKTGAKGFTSAFELLAETTIDIISICTPPAFHKDIAIAASEAGVHILCEKPLASTYEDARDIAEAVERTGATLHVGFCHRFEPAITEMKSRIESGKVGTLISIHNRFAGHMVNAQDTWFANPDLSGGGALADTAIHSIDIFRYLTGGQPITGVRSLAATQDTDLGPALKVEDSGTIVLQTESGAMGVLEASWRTPPGVWNVAVYGTGGMLQFDYNTHMLRHVTADGDISEESCEDWTRFRREFSHVIATWRGNATPRATVADGVEANRILAEAYKDSAR